jgi:predicted small metal-binding protein
MFGDKELRCDCGYEVREDDETARVGAVRRHASEAHGVDFSVELALQVVRRAGLGSGEQPSASGPASCE